MYWQMVLEEVLDRDHRGSFRFTNHGMIFDHEESSEKMREKNVGKEKRESFLIGGKYPNIGFSRREAECMIKLLSGKFVREVAEELGLSVRTVEYYINNMRAKLGCGSKAELIRQVAASSFLVRIKNSSLCGEVK